MNVKKKKGFTLAEVLITLGIIGIVAEITIPSLYHDFQEQNYKVAYKKAFSVASQAWANAVADYKIVPVVDIVEVNSKVTNFLAFESYFKTTAVCDGSNVSKCWANGEMSWGSAPKDDAYAFVDSSGMSWSMTSSAYGAGNNILVDTNGFKGPNKYGQDRFILDPVPASFQIPPQGTYNWNVVKTQLPGMPAKLVPNYTGDIGYDAQVCPSGAKHPCYYVSWLYN